MYTPSFSPCPVLCRIRVTCEGRRGAGRDAEGRGGARYEELGDIDWRGLDTEGEFLIERFNGFSAGEFIRERLRELFEQTRGAIDSRSASGIANTIARALNNQARVKAAAQETASRALSNALAIRQRNLDAVRDRIAAIRGR